MNVIPRVTFVLGVLLITTNGAADVRAPRVVSPHNADGYSMTTFGDFHRWRDLARDERAWEIYKYLADMGHWHCNAAREVRLNEPADELFVRYFGDPAINNFKIYAHCVENRPKIAGPVVITHTWVENGTEKTKRVELEAPREYEIVAGADPVDGSIEIAVPSDGPMEDYQTMQAVNSHTPSWVEPMREVHKRFTGERGTFSQFGDSITDSRAF